MASVDEWIEKYKQDIQSAKENTQDHKKLKECHLAAESIIKAILTSKGENFESIHNTTKLAENIHRLPNDKKKLLSYLYSVYDRRYPDDLDYS